MMDVIVVCSHTATGCMTPSVMGRRHCSYAAHSEVWCAIRPSAVVQRPWSSATAGTQLLSMFLVTCAQALGHPSGGCDGGLADCRNISSSVSIMMPNYPFLIIPGLLYVLNSVWIPVGVSHVLALSLLVVFSSCGRATWN
jgi:hypothetical protein